MANESEPALEEQAKPKSRWRPQISISTILLIITVVALWLAYYQAGQKLQRTNIEIANMKRFARELEVLDQNKFALISPHATKIGESIWKLFVPKQASSELRLIAGDIGLETTASTDVFGTPDQSQRLSAGKHTLELRYERDKKEAVVVVLMDGKEIMRQVRDPTWESGRGSIGGGDRYGELVTLPTDERVILYHRRFTTRNPPTTKTGPGIQLWIEPLKP